MTCRKTTSVPPDAEIFIGLRGGKFFIQNGERIYIITHKQKANRKYKAPRGAFQRYLENTMS